MALFGRKKTEEKEEAKDMPAVTTAPKKTPKAKSAVSAAGGADLSWVLKRPRITEKATDATMHSAYVFEVDRSANKQQIAQAVQALYKVNPVKVRTVQIPYKSVRNARTGISGMKRGGKKAYVYLKEGESISVM